MDEQKNFQIITDGHVCVTVYGVINFKNKKYFKILRYYKKKKRRIFDLFSKKFHVCRFFKVSNSEDPLRDAFIQNFFFFFCDNA